MSVIEYCKKCGGAMTSVTAGLVPLAGMHDDCLPPELWPAGGDAEGPLRRAYNQRDDVALEVAIAHVCRLLASIGDMALDPTEDLTGSGRPRIIAGFAAQAVQIMLGKKRAGDA